MGWFNRLLGKERYYKITIKGEENCGGCVVEDHELPAFLEDGFDQYAAQEVWMRPKDFHRLTEFEGF